MKEKFIKHKWEILNKLMLKIEHITFFNDMISIKSVLKTLTQTYFTKDKQEIIHKYWYLLCWIYNNKKY